MTNSLRFSSNIATALRVLLYLLVLAPLSDVGRVLCKQSWLQRSSGLYGVDLRCA
jgi:hypothetical protein